MKREFWIVNHTKKDVYLSDLGLVVRAKNCVDLLGGHYHLTDEQIISSIETGSLFKRRNQIMIKKNHISKDKQDHIDRGLFIPGQNRNEVFEEKKKYEELNIENDEEFAEKNS